MKSEEKPKNIGTRYLNVEPDTEHTVRVLEDALERIKSRQDEPNMVYNILSKAMSELIPLPCGEMFEKHQLMTWEPPENRPHPIPDMIHAAEEIETAVRNLEREGLSRERIQGALLDEFIRLFPANPFRDPVDVGAVEADYMYAEYAINRLDDMMNSLYRALNRATKQN